MRRLTRTRRRRRRRRRLVPEGGKFVWEGVCIKRVPYLVLGGTPPTLIIPQHYREAEAPSVQVVQRVSPK